MLWKFKNNRPITKWLKARQELLVLFNKVSGMQPFTEHCLETKEEILKEFHELFTDYMSCCHLEILQQLTAENEKLNSYNAHLDGKIVEQISNNTQNVIPLISSPAKILDNLNPLWRLFALRVELEDKLVNEYIAGKAAQSPKI